MLNVRNLTAGYGGAPVLRSVSFRLVPHTFTAVIGKNGCGKSTLVSCINQELRYTGAIAFADRDVALMPPKERARTIAVLPQVLASPRIPAEELVAFGRSPYLDLGGRLTEEDRAAVDEAIDLVGIGGLRRKTVDRMSGGERQKAYLAMILAQNTRLVVLDEPTTHMDMEYELAFLEKLTELKTRKKKTLLVVMHNIAQAMNYADRILLLHENRVAFDGSTDECLAAGVVEELFHLKRHETKEEGRRVVFFSAG